MKKILIGCLAVTMLVCLCACGGNNDADKGTDTTTTTTAATTTTTNGFTADNEDVFNDAELDWG